MGASASFAQTEPVDFLVPQVNSSLGQPIQAQVNLGQLDAAGWRGQCCFGRRRILCGIWGAALSSA